MLSLCRASYSAVAELCNHNVFLLHGKETGYNMWIMWTYLSLTRQLCHGEVILDTDRNDLYTFDYKCR